MKHVTSLLLTAALFACGSSKQVAPVDETDPAWEGPPPEAFATLDDDAIADVCATLRDRHMCAECACSAFGNAVGQGRATIHGVNVEGGDVAVDADIIETDDGWRLQQNP